VLWRIWRKGIGPAWEACFDIEISRSGEDMDFNSPVQLLAQNARAVKLFLFCCVVASNHRMIPIII